MDVALSTSRLRRALYTHVDNEGPATELTPPKPKTIPHDALPYTWPDSDEAVGPNSATPLKSYTIYNKNSFSSKYLQITHNNTILYYSTCNARILQDPVIHLAKDSYSGTIVASCRLQSWRRTVHLYLGNPACTDPASWTRCEAEGWTGGRFRFECEGRTYLWRRTKQKALGARRWEGKSFKLLDVTASGRSGGGEEEVEEGRRPFVGEADAQGKGRVLAAYISTQSLRNWHQLGRMDYYAELSLELQLMSLVAMMGIQEKARGDDRASAGGG